MLFWIWTVPLCGGGPSICVMSQYAVNESFGDLPFWRVGPVPFFFHLLHLADEAVDCPEIPPGIGNQHARMMRVSFLASSGTTKSASAMAQRAKRTAAGQRLFLPFMKYALYAASFLPHSSMLSPAKSILCSILNLWKESAGAPNSRRVTALVR